MPASTRSTYSLRAGVEAVIAFSFEHARDHDAAIDRGVFGDLARRRLKRALEDLNAGPFVAIAFRLFLRHGVHAAQQRQAAAGHDALGDGGLGRADGIVERLLLRFHFRLGGSADADHGDAAGELGQPLLQLLAVVVAGRLLDFAPDLLDAAIDLFALAGAADDRGVVLVDDDALGAPELLEVACSSLRPSSSEMTCPPVSTAMSCKHGLAAVAEIRAP